MGTATADCASKGAAGASRQATRARTHTLTHTHIHVPPLHRNRLVVPVLLGARDIDFAGRAHRHRRQRSSKQQAAVRMLSTGRRAGCRAKPFRHGGSLFPRSKPTVAHRRRLSTPQARPSPRRPTRLRTPTCTHAPWTEPFACLRQHVLYVITSNHFQRSRAEKQKLEQNSTCPPLSSSPHAHSFVIGPAVIKHTKGFEV